jgi:RHS repeat-associated protein
MPKPCSCVQRIDGSHGSGPGRASAARPCGTAAKRVDVGDRPLRVGFVSPDIREHPVARLLEPILRHLDRERFETFCYSDERRGDKLRIGASIIVVIWKSFAGKNDLRRLRLRDAETLIHAPVLTLRIKALAQNWRDTGAIDSNDLLTKVENPDLTTGAASTSSSNDVAYTVDALGEDLTMKDQNGTVHDYAWDSLGRETQDVVATLGGGVNGSVRARTYSYTVLGLPYLSTSYSNTSLTTVANQDDDVYNGFGQLTGEYQATSGAVVTGGPTPTPEVQYTYAGPSATQNYSRLSGMTSPDGFTLYYGYSNSSLDNAISRVDYLADSSAHLVDYQYLGLSTIVQQAFGNSTELTYIQQSGDAHAITSGSQSGGDEYTGLDSFGRVLDQNYVNTSTPTPTTNVRLQYGFDNDSDVLYADNLVCSTYSQLYHANSASSGDDNTAYDLLGRETAFIRGTLSASGNNSGSDGPLDTVSTVNSAAASNQAYTLDAVGNRVEYTTGGSCGTTTCSTFNDQNELTDFEYGGCACGCGTSYDNDGDTTCMCGCGTYAYDAWGDMVAYCNCSCGCGCSTNVYSSFRYDAEGRQISDDDTTVLYCTCGLYACTVNKTDDPAEYYDQQGQDIEDSASYCTSSVDCYTSCGCSCSTVCCTWGCTTSDYVWGEDYVNDLVLRDTSGTVDSYNAYYVNGVLTSGGTTTYGTQTPTRLWAEHDANYNVVALANNSGTVVERIDYDPYGNSTVLSASFGSTSYTLGTDPYQWVYGFQGGRLDPNSGLYHFGARMNNPVMETWMSQDPAGYVDGSSLYQFVGSSPADLADPTGLAAKKPTTNKSSGGSSGGINTNFPALPGDPGGAANGPARTPAVAPTPAGPGAGQSGQPVRSPGDATPPDHASQPPTTQPSSGAQSPDDHSTGDLSPTQSEIESAQNTVNAAKDELRKDRNDPTTSQEELENDINDVNSAEDSLNALRAKYNRYHRIPPPPQPKHIPTGPAPAQPLTSTSTNPCG